MDALLHFSDTPQLKVPGAGAGEAAAVAAAAAAAAPGPKTRKAAEEAARAALPPGPLLSTCSNDDHVDVPFPDWTHWGIGVRTQPASIILHSGITQYIPTQPLLYRSTCSLTQ